MSGNGGDVRVVLVGYGLGGAVFHAPVIAAVPGLRLAAIVTGNPARSAEARRDQPSAEILPDVDAVWNRASEFDVAVVAAANRAHVAVARGAIRAGLHVVVDKPLAATSADARALVEDARHADRILTVFQNRRWDGDFLTVRRILDEGLLGAPLRFESRIDRWRPAIRPGWRESADPEDAGGILHDLGSHLIDQALVLFGPAAEVHGELDRRRPGAVVPDDVFVAITHESGVRSHIGISMLAALPGPRFRLLGTAGTYEKRGLDVQEAALRATRRVTRAGWGAEPPDAWGSLSDGATTRAVPTEPGNYPAFYEAVRQAIRTGGPPPVDPMDAVSALEVIDRVRRRALAG